jgi:hypothetical protein
MKKVFLLFLCCSQLFGCGILVQTVYEVDNAVGEVSKIFLVPNRNTAAHQWGRAAGQYNREMQRAFEECISGYTASGGNRRDAYSICQYYMQSR